MQFCSFNEDLLIKICQYLLLNELITFGFTCKLHQSVSVNPNACERVVIHPNKSWIYYVMQYFSNKSSNHFRFGNAKKLHLLNCHKLYDAQLMTFIENMNHTKIPTNSALDILMNHQMSHNNFLQHFHKLNELHIACKSSHFLQHLPPQRGLQNLTITNIDAKFDFDQFLYKHIFCCYTLTQLSISYVNITNETLQILSKCINITLFDIGSCTFDGSTIFDPNTDNVDFISMNKAFENWNKLKELYLANCDMIAETLSNTEMSKIWHNILGALLNKESLEIFHFDILQCDTHIEMYPLQFVPNHLSHLQISLTARNISFVSGMLRHPSMVNKIWIDNLSIVEHYLSFIECVPLLLFCMSKARDVVEYKDIHQSTFNVFCDELVNHYGAADLKSIESNICKFKISVYVIYGEAFINKISSISHILPVLCTQFQIIGSAASLCHSSIDEEKLKTTLADKPFKVYRNDWDVRIESL